MAELPSDLLPIPTQPWDERPNALPLVVEEVRTALWLDGGNISAAAERLKVTSVRLRRFVERSPRLMNEKREMIERVSDRAMANLVETIHDDLDKDRRNQDSKWWLDRQARDRGFGGAGAKVSISTSGPVIVGWADGTTVSGEADDESFRGGVNTSEEEEDGIIIDSSVVDPDSGGNSAA